MSQAATTRSAAQSLVTPGLQVYLFLSFSLLLSPSQFLQCLKVCLATFGIRVKATKVDSSLHAQLLHVAAYTMQILTTFSSKNSPFVHLHVEMMTCCHGRALKFVPRGLARRLHSSSKCPVHPLPGPPSRSLLPPTSCTWSTMSPAFCIISNDLQGLSILGAIRRKKKVPQNLPIIIFSSRSTSSCWFASKTAIAKKSWMSVFARVPRQES